MKYFVAFKLQQVQTNTLILVLLVEVFFLLPRDLIKTFITFPKPIVAAVPGPAIGLGMAILPLCDVIYASDKALFYLPYSQLSQTPEGCISFTLPLAVGLAVVGST